MIRFASLFAGIGGFDLGAERSGMHCAWQVENDAHKLRVLQHHWPEVLKVPQVQDAGNHNLAPVDVVFFGSPCQDLSVAGKRGGLKAERSGLFYEACRILRELQPAIAVWENVPGAFSSNAGHDFRAVLSELVQCGARDIGWRVLDAQYFGLAQQRKRVFVVADFRGERAGQILFESPCGCGHPPARRKEGEEPTPILEAGARTNSDGYRDGDGIGEPGQPMYTLQARHQHAIAYAPEVPHALRSEGADASEDGTGRGTLLIAYQSNGPGSERTGALQLNHSDDNGSNHLVAYTVNAAESCAKKDHAFETDTARALDLQGGFSGNQGGNVIAYNIVGLGQQGNNHAYEADVTGTIQHKGNSASGNETGTVIAFDWQSAGSKDFVCPKQEQTGALGASQVPAVAYGWRVRRLMPVECSRLQGFPDDWLDLIPPLSDSAKYRMLGDAVAVPVAEWIARKIKTILSQEK